MNHSHNTSLPPMRPSTQPLGKHLIAEFYGARHLLAAKPAENVLRQAATAAKAHVLDVNLHDFGSEHGFTGVALLAESHISIHTWPEYAYAAIDIFMCGDFDPALSLAVLTTYFMPESTEVQILERGAPHKLHTSPVAALAE